MGNLSRLASILVAATVAGIGAAQAAVLVEGSSSGQFSNNAPAVSTSITESGTVLRWPSPPDSDGDQSTLTANAPNFSQAFNVPGGSLLVGSLTWFNASTFANQTPDTVTADLTWTVNYTSPGGATDSDVFNISITNTDNPLGDLLDGLQVTATDFGVPTILDASTKITGYYLALIGAIGTYNSTTGLWTAPEDKASVLGLYANVQVVPLPAAAWLLIAGIGGLGLASRRRKAA
jgi:hypothetical protein